MKSAVSVRPSFRWQLALTVSITVAVLALLFYDNDFDRYLAAVSGAEPSWLLSGAVMVVVLGVLRAWRLAAAIEYPLQPIFLRISLFHNFVTMVSPARIGEIAMPILLQRAGYRRPASAAGVLVVLRLLDLLSVLAVGGFATGLTAFEDPAYDWLNELGWWTGSLALGGFVVLPLVPGLIGAVFPPIGAPSSSRWIGAIRSLVTSARTCLVPRLYLRLVLFSLTALVSMLLVHYFCARAVSAAPSLAGTVVASTAAILVFTLPINGIGGLGPVQAAWSLALSAQGVVWETALTAGFLMYIVSLVVSGLMTGIANLLVPPGTSNMHNETT